MDPETLNECFDHVYKLMLECGVIVKEAVGKVKNVTTKNHRHDLLTEYDKRVEDILINGITAKYPNHKFFAEESCYGRALPKLGDDPTWIIDPIDGTGNFVRNFKLICISVGLAVSKQLVASICYNPCMDEMYTAKKGQGAYLNGERIHTSRCKEFKDAYFCFNIMGNPQNKPQLIARAMEFLKRNSGLRVFGSRVLALCYISSGIIDAFNQGLIDPWDAAGGILLIEEAGGCVKDVSGGPYNLMKPILVAAATEELCDEIISIIKEVNSRFE